MSITVKEVVRIQVEGAYKMGFLAHMRNDAFSVQPLYLTHLATTLESMGVDVSELQLDLLNSVNSGEGV